ncbi:MAG: hypothetical protein EKK46_09270 [Rhodocyclaceae bacterium]|nr:MAG: hypothetical protein EKK46_09270 [Rhodocyclaceae bacterium]
MYKKSVFLFLLAFTGMAVSAQIEMDQDLMQNIEDSTKSLTSNIALKDIKAGTLDAKELAEMFAKVEAFYTQKGGADDAVSLAKKSRELSLQVGQDIVTRNFDHANEIATTMSKTCKTCHSIYKKDA